MAYTWKILEGNRVAEERLRAGLGIGRIAARALVNRGITAEDEARRFLSPSLSDLPDPFLLPDMAAAVERIAMALSSGEKIAIFGDYDADGVTGAALLASFLKELGHSPLVGLPDRRGEGYGLTPAAVEDFNSQGARLIVTVDNGTRATEGIASAKGFGIDVVVTDHHEAKGELPSAHAIVNPQRLAGYSPHRELSGCGVAFMLALALRKKLRGDGKLTAPEPNLKRQLDLVALGTIADVVPLSGANRILVRHGLGEIAGARRPGVAALIEVSSTNNGEMNPDSIAFQLAPRLNAAGRLGSAHEALDLLMCDDPSRSLEIARSLDRANRERQRVEGVILEEAYAMLSARGSTGQSSVV
ncbi:MAG: DHH family phosphoesterase, partial [Pseudomonadota bacterium]